MNTNKQNDEYVRRNTFSWFLTGFAFVTVFIYFSIGLTQFVYCVEPQAVVSTAFKIGYVDLEVVGKNSLEGKKAVEAITTFRNTRQKEITAKEQEVVDMQADFDKKKFTLSSDARDQRNNEITKKKVDLKRFVEDSELEIDKMQKNYLEPVHTKIFETIKEYGSANGYAVIFERSTLIYTNPAFDISSEIIKALDAKYPATTSSATTK
ncbi:MAG: hypothetical protein A2161_13070 [Candidatus Schekmanbacteria bacterium RBG_13_48_7]|uniref:Outer membrane chaperone Skp n=1 Tax=Candidatus Schekmanbacteria bacterium RBG_13_48_7 TaxID=1817878 RepID=A0A1F7RLC9_9BACT|nr:MAG: hypothetical protein A2161_13070 [Candidatus Schekmanbacteria bacterium RBG_13_48_7]